MAREFRGFWNLPKHNAEAASLPSPMLSTTDYQGNHFLKVQKNIYKIDILDYHIINKMSIFEKVISFKKFALIFEKFYHYFDLHPYSA